MENTSIVLSELLKSKEIVNYINQNPGMAILLGIGIPLTLDFVERIITKIMENEYRVSVKYNEGFVFEKSSSGEFA